MEALILAAGFGSRLWPISPSKPLATVDGTPLIVRAVRAAAKAGASRIVVVTGYLAEEVEAVLAREAAAIGVAVIPCRIEDYTRPNGWSVIAGAELIRGPFLLMMADHLFAPEILDALVDSGAPQEGVRLAIDRRVDHDLIDAHDATWVRTDASGRIEAIGKTIAPYNGVDCGAFIATQALPSAIRSAVAEQRPGSLSDGMQWLADRDQAWTVDIGDSWWIDVDDPRMLLLAEAWLADKGKPAGEGRQADGWGLASRRAHATRREA